MLSVTSSGLAAAVLAGSLAGLAADARAAVVVNIYQDGSDVRSVLSGSFNTGIPVGSNQGLGLSNTVWGGTDTNNVIFSSGSSGGTPGVSRVGSVLSTPGATRFGNSAASLANASSFTVSGFTTFRIVWYTNGTPYAEFDNAYAGGAMSGDALFAGRTMADLGLENYGSFVFGFGSGGTTDTVTVNLLQAPPGPGPGVVPLPGAAGLAAVGLAGLSRRRRR